MNTLSWLLYLADVAGAAKGVGIALVCGSAALSAGMAFAGAMSIDLAKYEPDPGAARARSMKLVTAWKKLLPVAIIGAFMLVLSPTQNTIYAIAASEMGEEVLKSETASKATKALNAWLDQQIAKNGGQQ